MARSKNTPTKKRAFKTFYLSKRNFKVPMTTFNEIRRLQRSVSNCIPKLPFSRVIRELLQNVERERPDFSIQLRALQALQEAGEIYMVTLFEDANLAAAHAGRITLQPGDVQLVLKIRSPWDPYNL